MAKVAEKSVWHKLLDDKYSRRTVLQSVVAAGVAGGLKVADAQGELDMGSAQVANNGAPAASVGGALKNRPPFTPIDTNFADTLTLPEGYSYQLLAPWGEVLNEAGDEIGFNHDFAGFFPIDMLEGGRSSSGASTPARSSSTPSRRSRRGSGIPPSSSPSFARSRSSSAMTPPPPKTQDTKGMGNPTATSRWTPPS